MAQILDIQGLQHYANKMCNADNRKVGTKSLPTVLNEIDTAIDGFKTAFEKEYGNPVNMEITNNQNIFTIGTGNNADKKNDVENSFTNLKISGNSLVNLANEWQDVTNATITGYYGSERTICELSRLKNNTWYTLILNYQIIPNSTIAYNTMELGLSNSKNITTAHPIASQTACQFVIKNGLNIIRIHLSDYKHDQYTYLTIRPIRRNTAPVAGESVTFFCFNAILLEGDYTNKSIPEYFEGLQSVGEKQDGNHKLNISSIGKNLFDIGLVKGAEILSSHTNSFTFQGWASRSISNVHVKKMFKPNTTYTIQTKVRMIQKVGTVAVYQYKVGGQFYHANMIPSAFGVFATSEIRNTGNIAVIKTTFTTPSCIDNYELRLYSNRYAEGNVTQFDVIEFSEIQLEEASTNSTFEFFKADKKEILFNEPLRGIPNGVKDTIEKINGEWKIIRRCGEIILNGKEDWSLWSHYGNNFREDRSVVSFRTTLPLAVLNASTAVLCNNFITGGVTWDSNNDNNTNHTYYTKSKELIYCYYANATTKQALGVSIKTSKLGLNASNWTVNSATSNFKQWLSQHPTKVIYQLEMPIIEDIDPVTLQCWKNGTISIIDEAIPVETTHTVALNKSAQIQKNIEELTSLRNRVETLEEQYNKTALNQAYETELLKLDMKLDNII